MHTNSKSKVDVIIVGAGPAGLMAATWLSHLGIPFRIVDKRWAKVSTGQADGLHPRTLEILDSFDIADHAVKMSVPVNAINTWYPDQHGVIKRVDSFRMGGQQVSDIRFGPRALHQGLIEDILLDAISAKSGAVVERGVIPDALTVDASSIDDEDAYPVHVRLRHLAQKKVTSKTASFNSKPIHDGIHRSNMTADDTADVLLKSDTKDVVTEDVEAKYLIGCDGAHSWIRKQLGFKLEGETSDSVWGVVDGKIVTDFPDSRMMNAIHSVEHRSMILIPREKGLVRMLVRLNDINAQHSRFDRSTFTPQKIIEIGRDIIRPYKIQFTNIDWWTVYQVGQRVGDHFSFSGRVFLAGDAVHTHSPKAGQGMNTSMGDTYNLGWKLGSVIQGVSQRNLLQTYEIERRAVAQKLIEFDHRLNLAISSTERSLPISSSHRTEPREFVDIYRENGPFMFGMGISYGPSLITSALPTLSDNLSSRRISKIDVGYRINDYPLISQSCDQHEPLQRLVPSDGRWRVLLFAGDLAIESQTRRLESMCETLNGPGSFIRRFTPASKAVDAVIEVLAIHASPRDQMADFKWPRLLQPFKGAEGWDYGKVWADDGELQTYALLGIDKNTGCAVIVRPDQYVSWVGEVDDYNGMNSFFRAFMKEQKVEHEGAVGVDKSWPGY